MKMRGVIFLLVVVLVVLFRGGAEAAAQYGETSSVEVGDSTVVIDTTGWQDPTRDTVRWFEVTTGEPSATGSSTRGTVGRPFVDSVFMDGRVIRLTVRIADEVRRDTARLRAILDSIEGTTQALIAANLNLNPADWKPTEAEVAERRKMIERAQDFEYIYPQDITRIPVVSIPLSSIGQALGLTEDTSPLITYRLEQTRKITVIVYTVIGALELVRLVDGAQRPGDYRFKWDFKDSNGRRALSGSYIVEVIADGKERLLRKRIVVP